MLLLSSLLPRLQLSTTLRPPTQSLTLALASADCSLLADDAFLHRLALLLPHTLRHSSPADNTLAPACAPSPSPLSHLPAAPSSFDNTLPTPSRFLARSPPLVETLVPLGCCSLSSSMTRPSRRLPSAQGSSSANSKNVFLSQTAPTLPRLLTTSARQSRHSAL